MSIADRLLDARLLYDAGRYEGALLSVLVAAAGSSRRRFPKGAKSRKAPSKEMGDREAFETFVAQEMRRVGTCGVYFNGMCTPAEEIFYKWLRCSLAHEAQLPEQILFKPGRSGCEAEICPCAGPPERLVITHPVVLLIGHLVCTAKENSDIPASVERAMAPAVPGSAMPS